MTQVEVPSVTGSGRRRRWSMAEKIRIVEESLSRPRRAASTVRRYDISRALLTRWCRECLIWLLGCCPLTRFASVLIAPAPVQTLSDIPVASHSADMIGIALVNGRRLMVSWSIDPALSPCISMIL